MDGRTDDWMRGPQDRPKTPQCSGPGAAWHLYVFVLRRASGRERELAESEACCRVGRTWASPLLFI